MGTEEITYFTCPLVPRRRIGPEGTEEIFPGQTIKFGRHFEWVEKNFNFSTHDPGRLRARAYGVIFFSKNIYFLVQHMGTGPQVKMVFRYGLHP